MKRLLALIAGGFGLVALLRRRHRQHRKPVVEGPDPANELRAKLADSRSIADEREVDEGGQTTVDAAPDPDPAARRRDVHEQARQALDELQ